MAGKLSIVATPIGNLEDITLRALRTLKEADIVACEDTRVTRKLLAHFDIHTPASTLPHVPRLLSRDKWVALVTDAGMPGISDPGLEIVSNARKQGVAIETVPGSSALTAAISISGLKMPSFIFYGFLPHKKGREKLLKEVAASERAVIFFESPHRILKTLDALARLLQKDRQIGLFRELTKLHEESIVGTVDEVIKHLVPEKRRGEFVIIVEAQ